MISFQFYATLIISIFWFVLHMLLSYCFIFWCV